MVIDAPVCDFPIAGEGMKAIVVFCCHCVVETFCPVPLLPDAILLCGMCEKPIAVRVVAEAA